MATHFNTGTYHNHFVINSVNMWTGKKLEAKYEVYYEAMNIQEIQISECREFKNNPYRVRDDMAMEMLNESIKENGILIPIVVTPTDGCFEIISGHRRIHAAKKAGLATVPAFVRKLDRDSAVIFMVDSNLHREGLLPSEKAFAYKLKMEALKSQGKRTDITSSQVATRFDAASEIGKSSGESRDQAFRYIRLTNLIPEILQMVDDGKIALTPAVELSYLTKDEQKNLHAAMDYDGVTPSLSQAQRLHRLSGEQNLSEQVIADVLSEVKGNQKECVRVPIEDIGKYFRPGTSIKQMAETIVKAMDYYNRYLERNRDRER